MIIFDRVGLVLNNIKILQNVSFSIERGEFVYLLGASGAGKSSILRLVHCDLFPTTGTVLVQSAETKRLGSSKIARLRRSVGFIFQDFKLLKDKTAYENVAFALEVTGARKKIVHQKALQALHTVGMSHRLTHFPADLSGGECQRVAIARAIVQEPIILLADEPTGNLDDKNTDDLIDLLDTINKNGTAIMMATHRKGLIERVNGRTLTLSGGRIS